MVLKIVRRICNMRFLNKKIVPKARTATTSKITNKAHGEIDKRISFHTARHTNATLLIYSGANITTVQKLLGHKSVKTTQVYANIMDITLVRDLEKAIYSKAGGKHKGN